MTGEYLDRLRAKAPTLHYIGNYVSANDCANLILACGAFPVMADDPSEAVEIAARTDALVLNLGIYAPRKARAMLRAGRAANRRGIPVTLDPVGAGASHLRLAAAQRLLREVRFAAIRGNAAEITALARGNFDQRGVESAAETAPEPAEELARRWGTTVVMSGRRDVVTDGRITYFAENGHAMMRRVSGAGCMLSAAVGAFIGANSDAPREAALAACCAWGRCGEIARERLGAADGNAAYRNFIIDAMDRMDGRALEEGAKYVLFRG